MAVDIMNIVLADDDSDDRLLFEEAIEEIDVKTNLSLFKDGKELLDYLLLPDTILPEIVFLDLNMPIMDGWEFLERFTKIKNKFNSPITLYVVSSSINSIDIEKAKSLS